MATATADKPEISAEEFERKLSQHKPASSTQSCACCSSMFDDGDSDDADELKGVPIDDAPEDRPGDDEEPDEDDDLVEGESEEDLEDEEDEDEDECEDADDRAFDPAGQLSGHAVQHQSLSGLEVVAITACAVLAVDLWLFGTWLVLMAKGNRPDLMPFLSYSVPILSVIVLMLAAWAKRHVQHEQRPAVG